MCQLIGQFALHLLLLNDFPNHITRMSLRDISYDHDSVGACYKAEIAMPLRYLFPEAHAEL
jgi:hypothetical protein